MRRGGALCRVLTARCVVLAARVSAPVAVSAPLQGRWQQRSGPHRSRPRRTAQQHAHESGADASGSTHHVQVTAGSYAPRTRGVRVPGTVGVERPGVKPSGGTPRTLLLRDAPHGVGGSCCSLPFAPLRCRTTATSHRPHPNLCNTVGCTTAHAAISHARRLRDAACGAVSHTVTGTTPDASTGPASEPIPQWRQWFRFTSPVAGSEATDACPRRRA